tara:strand:- start:2427 stop:2873 length:447 start_codon:yes stop_codon:yes gene_type:complete
MASYKTYPWVNTITGKKPVTGDEFLYVFFSHKDEPEKTFLCMNPSTHPIKKHPIGFLGVASFILLLIIGDTLGELIYVFGGIFIISLITGSLMSFGHYISYYKKERKWKQQVINDWKSDKLRYKHSEATLSTYAFKLGGSPIDESAFF